MPQRGAHDPIGTGSVEGGEANDLGRARALHRDEHRLQRVHPVELVAPVAPDQHDASFRQAPGEVGEQLEARFVRPVQILDDREADVPLRRIAEQVDEGVVDAESIAALLGADVRVGKELGQQRHERREAAAKRGTDPARSRLVRYLSQDVDERTEGPPRLDLGALADEGAPASLLHAVDEMTEERRLPDPRVARDEDRPHRRCPVEHRVERRHLALTADEIRTEKTPRRSQRPSSRGSIGLAAHLRLASGTISSPIAWPYAQTSRFGGSTPCAPRIVPMCAR